jgi:hypothetical protein
LKQSEDTKKIIFRSEANTSDSKQTIFEAKRTSSILKGNGNEPVFPTPTPRIVDTGSRYLKKKFV